MVYLLVGEGGMRLTPCDYSCCLAIAKKVAEESESEDEEQREIERRVDALPNEIKAKYVALCNALRVIP